MPPQQIYSQAFQQVFDNENIPKGPVPGTTPAPVAKTKAAGKKIKFGVKRAPKKARPG